MTKERYHPELSRFSRPPHVYLNPATDGRHLYDQLHAYFTYYNHHRHHQALKGQTSAHIFAQPLPLILLQFA